MSVDLTPHYSDNINLIFTQLVLRNSLTFSAQGGWSKEKKVKPVAKLPAEARGEAPSEATNSIWWT